MKYYSKLERKNNSMLLMNAKRENNQTKRKS